MSIKRLSILDIPEIVKFVNSFHYPMINGMSSYIATLIRNGGWIFVPSEEPGMMVLSHPLSPTQAECHVYIECHLRGLQALRFARECYEWGWENTEVQSVINKVPIEDHKLRMFMGMLRQEELSRNSNEITYIRYREEN